MIFYFLQQVDVLQRWNKERTCSRRFKSEMTSTFLTLKRWRRREKLDVSLLAFEYFGKYVPVVARNV